MNKNNNALYKVLQDYHRKRITLEELNRICSDPEQITELTEQGALVPVKKSGTNGNMKTPLFCVILFALRSRSRNWNTNADSFPGR